MCLFVINYVCIARSDMCDLLNRNRGATNNTLNVVLCVCVFSWMIGRLVVFVFTHIHDTGKLGHIHRDNHKHTHQLGDVQHVNVDRLLAPHHQYQHTHLRTCVAFARALRK